MPDPFVITIGLTFFIFLVGLVFTPSSAHQMVTYWGDGFWNIIVFTLQMVMVLLSGFILGTAPAVKRFLSGVASFAKTPSQAVVLTTVVSCVACWLNWSLGLVVGAIFCRQVIRVVPKANYRLLVASAYSGFVLWHAGLSGSIPLLISTPGNFTEKTMGGVIPVSETVFGHLNLTAVFLLLLTLPVLNALMNDKKSSSAWVDLGDDDTSEKKVTRKSFLNEKLDHSPWVSVFIFLLGAVYIFSLFQKDQFRLDLNRLNFILLFVGILLHRTPVAFVNAARDGASRVGPILVQFPFYAGIMAMMKESGLAQSISEGFISISTPATFALWTFYSAGLVNFFVPSGGGQWAIQGPIMIPAAQALGVDVVKTAMAVAWGDAWTNLAQPFWTLPLLAIAGLRVRDIMGYCVTALLVTGVVLSVVFLAF